MNSFDWRSRRVFISGGNGVIGREMARKLVDRGAVVWVGDLKPRGTHLPNNINYRRGDLNSLTVDEVNTFAPDIFFHLAATFERSTETYEFWQENFRHNVALSHHLMSVLKDCPSLRRVVFASSYLIYDPALYTFSEPVSVPYSLRETDPVLPRNLTGMAKLAHEIELRFLETFRAKQFSSVCARIYRGYGCNSRDIISRWVRELLKDQPITVYRPEGIFDYIYAEDTAEGLIRMAESHTLTGIVNLGTGKARKVADVVTTLRNYFPTMQVTTVESDIPFEGSQAEMTLYQQAINWLPQHTLETAIPKIIDFEKQRLTTGYQGGSTEAVLITSISRKVPLLKAVKAAMEHLGSEGNLIGGDINSNCLGRYFVDDFWQMPALNSQSIEAWVEQFASRHITVIIPTRDGELAFWSQYKDYLQQHGITVMVSDPASVTYCLDKLEFYKIGQAERLPFIFTTDSLYQISDGPLVVKERFGAGSANIKLNVNHAEAQRLVHTFEHPIYQPYIRGKEYSADGYVTRNGQLKGLIIRTRDQVVQGESQITTTVHDPQLEAIITQTVNALKLYGHVVLQLLKDEVGAVHVIECNPRFGGASTLSIAAGLDSFSWLLLEHQGESIDDIAFQRPTKPLRQVRYPADMLLAW